MQVRFCGSRLAAGSWLDSSRSDETSASFSAFLMHTDFLKCFCNDAFWVKLWWHIWHWNDLSWLWVAECRVRRLGLRKLFPQTSQINCFDVVTFMILQFELNWLFYFWLFVVQSLVCLHLFASFSNGRMRKCRRKTQKSCTHLVLVPGKF